MIADVGQLDGNNFAERGLDIIRKSQMYVAVFDPDPNMLVADFDFFFFHNAFLVHYSFCLQRVKAGLATRAAVKLDKLD